MPVASTGVTVVSGFLGSGKTTLLQRLVRDPELGPTLAVIVNELGALGLDQELIASERATPTMQVRQLTSGCVCCTLRGDLLPALQELRDLPDPQGRPRRHILIETSGAAQASEVSYAVNTLSFDAPFHTDAVVTLVDAHNARRAHGEHADLFEDQVRSADLILLNKADLVTEPAAQAELEEWIQTMAPRASRVWTQHAEVDPDLLLGLDLLRTGAGAAGGGEAGQAGGGAAGGGAPAAHGLHAVTVPVSHAVRRDGLEDLLEELADHIYRIKGVVDVIDGDQPAAPWLIQAVGDRIDLDLLPAASPLRGSARRLIFIGAGLGDKDRDLLAERLAELR